jgi:L,D-transpeptidase ErfK/SrfK
MGPLAKRLQGAAGALLVAAACGAPAAHGATFALPEDGSTIVGRVQVVTDIGSNTLLDIARRYDLGYEEIVAANPGMSVWLPPQNGRIVVPTQFVLPQKPWAGIVINVAQRRLFHFPEPKKGEAPRVVTYPLGVARGGWPTPLGRTAIVAKYRDPAWRVPQSIHDERRSEGEPALPAWVPPGPDNPMGMHALETGFRSIFIHATNRPWGIGLRVTHGCLRLYPEDAAELFAAVRIGTPVRIVDERFAVGVRAGRAFMASFEAAAAGPEVDKLWQAASAVDRVLEGEARRKRRVELDWSRVREAALGRHVIPFPLSAPVDAAEDTAAGIAAQRYPYAPYDLDANGSLPPAGS